MLKVVPHKDNDRFDGVSEQSWDYIKQHGEFFETGLGQTILQRGQTDEHLLIVLQGCATLVYFEDDQPRPTAIYRTPGQVLHHAGMHLKLTNPFEIQSAADLTRVVLIQRDDVYKLIESDVSFAEFLFRDLSERFMVSLSYLQEQRQEPLINRLAGRILTITKHRRSVEFTQAELAEILAVTRISISKAIKTLEQNGLIQRAERSLILVDRDKLKSWLAAQRANSR